MSIFIVLESCQGVQLPVAARRTHETAVARSRELATVKSQRLSQVESLSNDDGPYGAKCVFEEVVFTVAEVKDCDD